MNASKPRRAATKAARRQGAPYPTRGGSGGDGSATTTIYPSSDTVLDSAYKDSELVSGLGQMLRTPSPRRSPRLARRRAARRGIASARSLSMEERESHVIPTSPVRSLQRIGLPSSFSSSSLASRPSPVACYILSHHQRSDDLARVTQPGSHDSDITGQQAKGHNPGTACTSTGDDVGIDGHRQQSIGFGDIPGLDDDPGEEVEIASRHVLSQEQSISFLSCYQ
eukprot:TRINITY_DN8531_c0_g1_i2.p1 TRINITY_DN8531_c0_g1~~TRINITY_DN8531_c0_g1_i2.p1  ORF type:complete len:224 (-),score=6.49 TRINITY_DN8531_c0_g1_i2:89-760(-)